MNDHRSTEATGKTGQFGDEAELFERHHQALIRAVARIVNTDRANVEDACSYAWMQLLRYGPERGERLFAWLRIVAVREAIFHDRRFRRMEAFDEDTIAHVLQTAVELDDEVDAHEALTLVGELPERQRQAIALQVAGYTYDEIAAITGDTPRTVERQLMRAKRRLDKSR